MTSNPTATDRYRVTNRKAAEIIAADPVQYAGAVAEWARTVLSRPATPRHANVLQRRLDLKEAE